MCNALHGGVSCTQQVVGVDHDIETMRREFIFGDSIETGGHAHKRYIWKFLAIDTGKIKHLVRRFFAAVYHNAICTGACVSQCAHKRIVHAFIKKTPQTPDKELKLARKRAKELLNG